MKLYPKSREEWLKLRETTIGGSEISSIVGLNPYQTPRDVWELKTGRKKYDEPTWAMRLGIHFEKGVADIWQEETGNRVIKCSSKDVMYVHPEHEFLTGTPDRRYFSKDGDKGVLEVKTTIAIIDYEEIPESWEIQLQWYMGLVGLKKGTIAWFEYRSRELKQQEYDFNPELFGQLVDIAVDFFTNNIANDTEPEAINSNDLKKLFSREEQGKVIEASSELQEVYSQIKALQAELSPLNKEVDGLKEQVKMVMRDAESVKYIDQYLFTWKVNKSGSRVFTVK
jgi:putative phage-type endonuclease